MTDTDLVPDSLWALIEPLLPHHRPDPRGGRPPIPDRRVLAAIVYMLRTGVPWRLLPAKQLGAGSPTTCWRRVRDWQQAGVWEQLHRRVLDELHRQGRLDFSRASLDSISVRAKRGGSSPVPIPSIVASPGPSTTCSPSATVSCSRSG
jgi:transposase